jgi:predicted phosphate transport protein (TIGR00153 family)
MRLLPRDEKFYEMFTAVARLNVDAAKLLRDLVVAEPAQRRPIVDAIKRLEHQADEITHEVVGRLDRTFITPLDREDIHLLASRLDDVMDLMDGTARRIQMFHAGKSPDGAAMLTDVIHRANIELLGAVLSLENDKAGVVLEACKTVKHLEEDGDSLYHEWVGKLFERESDPMQVIKWMEIYEHLERTLDQAEDVSNVLESIFIKHA